LGNLPTDPKLDLPTFWALYSKLVGGLMKEGAHAEVALSIQGGQIKQVRVNRSYLPANLPNLP
jgi:hypothetical protein